MYVEELLSKNKRKMLVIITSILGVYLGMKYLIPVFIPFLMAGVLTKIFLPQVEKIHKCTHIGKSVIAGVLLFVSIWFFVGVFYILLGPMIADGMDCLKDQDKMYRIESRIKEGFCCFCEEIEIKTGLDADRIENTISDSIHVWMKNLSGKAVPGMMYQSVDYLKKAAGFGAMLIVTFVSYLFLISDYHMLYQKFQRYKLFQTIRAIILKIIKAAKLYLRAQIIIMTIVSLLCIGTFLLCHMKYGVTIGILIGFCDVLPFIGTGIVLVPWAVILLLLTNYKMAAIMMILYVACSFVRSLLEPKLIGKKLGVYPIAVLASIYTGIRLFGMTGIVTGPISVLIIYEIVKSYQSSDS